MSGYTCTHVSELCPVEATTLGYYPNKALNIFIAAAFGLALFIQLVIGVWKRTWSFTSFIVAGCALEIAGGFSSLHETRDGEKGQQASVKLDLGGLLLGLGCEIMGEFKEPGEGIPIVAALCREGSTGDS